MLEHIKKFIETAKYYTKLIGGDEPLDGDETQEIADFILLELDIINGNITVDEYIEKSNNLETNKEMT